MAEEDEFVGGDSEGRVNVGSGVSVDGLGNSVVVLGLFSGEVNQSMIFLFWFWGEFGCDSGDERVDEVANFMIISEMLFDVLFVFFPEVRHKYLFLLRDGLLMP